MTELATKKLQEEIAELEEWLLLNPYADASDKKAIKRMIINKELKLNELNK